MSAAVILQSARLPFLLLPPACVALGAALVWASGQPVPVIPLILALLGAVLAHVAVNTLNEYQDFTSGLDLRTQRTPFSGGSGALPQHPEQRYWVLAAALVSLGLVILIGLYFIQRHGPAIAPLGLVGVLLILVYTRWINRRPWLCLVAPGLGFGLLMVAGTQFVLTGSYWWSAWLLGLIPFMLVNNLLLLNQYPDAEADAASGRYHFPIAYGFRASNRAYLLMWLAALALLRGGCDGGAQLDDSGASARATRRQRLCLCICACAKESEEPSKHNAHPTRASSRAAGDFVITRGGGFARRGASSLGSRAGRGA